MTSKEKRELEDAEYDRQQAEDKAQRSARREREAGESARRERASHEEERGHLEQEIEDQKSARYDAENERDELKDSLAQEQVKVAALLAVVRFALATMCDPHSVDTDPAARQLKAMCEGAIAVAERSAVAAEATAQEGAKQ